MRVHAIEVGRLQFPDTWFKAASMGDLARSLLRGIGGPDDEIPIISYVVEHDDGHIVIDTGIDSAAAQRLLRNPLIRRVFNVTADADEEIGPQMRKIGLRPEDVAWVLPTHLDIDHAGGVHHFPNARCLIHRPEWELAQTRHPRTLVFRKDYPDWFRPEVYDLDPDPIGPFDRSLRLTDRGDVFAVPTPGHSRDHVGIVIRGDVHLFFGGDHIIKSEWFVRDQRMHRQNPQPYQRLANDTSKRLREFVDTFPTILLPSHDGDAAKNIAGREPLKI